LLDLGKATESTSVITVKPSNNLFKELGHNTLDYLDAISELIDNAVARRVEGELLHVEIEIGVSSVEKDKDYLLIRDNASGISPDNLSECISPAAIIGKDSLNEHGMGMKQAIPNLGRLRYLATKTKDTKPAIVVEEFKFGKIRPKTIEVPWSHGTEIVIDSLSPMVIRSHLGTGYSKIASYLGARYRRFMKPENRCLTIVMKMKDIETDNEIPLPEVKELRPVYFHPRSRLNQPTIINKKFKSPTYSATLTMGYAPTDFEYKELGLEEPKQYEPYHVTLYNQGIDIIRNDRVILFHQLSQIGLVSARHNRYNYVRGELDLHSGFKTGITKNSIIEDENYQDLVKRIREDPDVKALLQKYKTFPEELPENALRDRLADHLRTRAIDPKSHVSTEYAVQGLGGFIDVLADGEPYEIKSMQADGLDVYQLFAYMDMGERNDLSMKRGYLIAPSFTTGASEASKFIEKKHGKIIVLAPLADFPVNQPMSTEEIEKYLRG
jgi:hypothetical protein